MLLSTFAMLRWWPCIVLANEMTQHHLMLRRSLKCKGSFKDCQWKCIVIRLN